MPYISYTAPRIFKTSPYTKGDDVCEDLWRAFPGARKLSNPGLGELLASQLGRTFETSQLQAQLALIDITCIYFFADTSWYLNWN